MPVRWSHQPGGTQTGEAGTQECSKSGKNNVQDGKMDRMMMQELIWKRRRPSHRKIRLLKGWKSKKALADKLYQKWTLMEEC